MRGSFPWIPSFPRAVSLTGDSVDGPQGPQDAHGADGREADVVSIQGIFHHPGGKTSRAVRMGVREWESGKSSLPASPRGVKFTHPVLPAPPVDAIPGAWKCPRGLWQSGIVEVIPTHGRGGMG